jgi:hypothetical protein
MSIPASTTEYSPFFLYCDGTSFLQRKYDVSASPELPRQAGPESRAGLPCLWPLPLRFPPISTKTYHPPYSFRRYGAFEIAKTRP